jgi:hypothetical protein
MAPCPAEDTISERTKTKQCNSSYYIRKRDPYKVEWITEPEVSHGDQIDRVPTQGSNSDTAQVPNTRQTLQG